MHYYPSFDLEKVSMLTIRQTDILLEEINAITKLFNPDPKEANKATKDAARKLGCKNPDALND